MKWIVYDLAGYGGQGFSAIFLLHEVLERVLRERGRELTVRFARFPLDFRFKEEGPAKGWEKKIVEVNRGNEIFKEEAEMKVVGLPALLPLVEDRRRCLVYLNNPIGGEFEFGDREVMEEVEEIMKKEDVPLGVQTEEARDYYSSKLNRVMVLPLPVAKEICNYSSFEDRKWDVCIQIRRAKVRLRDLKRVLEELRDLRVVVKVQGKGVNLEGGRVDVVGDLSRCEYIDFLNQAKVGMVFCSWFGAELFGVKYYEQGMFQPLFYWEKKKIFGMKDFASESSKDLGRLVERLRETLEDRDLWREKLVGQRRKLRRYTWDNVIVEYERKLGELF